MKRVYTEKEKQVLLKLASQCVWSDPTKKPTARRTARKRRWYHWTSNWMLIAIWSVEIIGFVVSAAHQWKFWGVVFSFGFLAALCSTAYIKWPDSDSDGI